MSQTIQSRNKAQVLEAFETFGVLAEHWAVIQDEATQKQSKSGNPLFGNVFPERDAMNEAAKKPDNQNE